MGWKIRKDKPNSDSETADEPDDQMLDAEATSPQLPDDTSDTEDSSKRSAFVLDLDSDALQTDGGHTSPDSSSFGWTPPSSSSNDSYTPPSFDDPDPSFAEPADAPPGDAHNFDLTSYMHDTPAADTAIELGTSMDPNYPAQAEAEEHSSYIPNTYAQPGLSYTDPAPSFDAPASVPIGDGFADIDGGLSIPKVSPFIVDEEKPQTEPHRLVIKLGNLSAAHALEKEVTTIGRPDDATQNYPDVEIDLDDGVSRKHAEVRRRENEFFLVDVGSTNGTILNGEQIREFQEVSLFHGDRIRLGERTEIIFE